MVKTVEKKKKTGAKSAPFIRDALGVQSVPWYFGWKRSTFWYTTWVTLAFWHAPSPSRDFATIFILVHNSSLLNGTSLSQLTKSWNMYCICCEHDVTSNSRGKQHPFLPADSPLKSYATLSEEWMKMHVKRWFCVSSLIWNVSVGIGSKTCFWEWISSKF